MSLLKQLIPLLIANSRLQVEGKKKIRNLLQNVDEDLNTGGFQPSDECEEAMKDFLMWLESTEKPFLSIIEADDEDDDMILVEADTTGLEEVVTESEDDDVEVEVEEIIEPVVESDSQEEADKTVDSLEIDEPLEIVIDDDELPTPKKV